MSGQDIPQGRVDLLLDKLERERVGPQTRMQCKVCWWIYDPAEGCDEWDVAPGTPFTELPDYFSCPGCGHPTSAFLPCPEDANFDPVR